ncbi:MAG: hypothetical protein QXU98_07720 [Candidatus Parvarchaeota archaeon]
MFGRRRNSIDDEDERPSEAGEELVLRQRSPRKAPQEQGADIGDYLIIGVAFLVLMSLVFLFYSVVPSLGFEIYSKGMQYLWKPLSWMPMWVFIVIFLFLFITVDHVKPIVYFKDDHKWYRRKYEKNGLIHFVLYRPWGGELIVDSRKVAGRDARKYVINSNLDIIWAGKNIHVEGTDVFEVTRFTDMERRLAMKDQQIAILQRQLESLTGRSFYWEKEMARVRSQGDKRNE